MHRLRLLVLLAVASSGAALAARAQDAPSASADGHARMLAELARIKDELPRSGNVYLGGKALDDLHAELEKLDGRGKPMKRVMLLRSLAFHELRLGRVEEALAHAGEARDIVTAPDSKLPAELRLETIFDLGVVYMRLGEIRNCCARMTSESCILPIRGGGVHVDLEGSQRAMECFGEVARTAAAGTPTQIKARWLLNVAAMTLGVYPDGVEESLRVPPSTLASAEPFPRFENVAERAGVEAFGLAGGAAADDFDGDGRIDLFVSTSDTAGQLRLFSNRGDGTFEDRTERAGLTGLYGGLNLIDADYDNDGDLDLYVLRGAWWRTEGRHPNSLIRNEGGGRFRDVTFESGLGAVFGPTQTADWADYDRDGDLDLYVGHETDPEVPVLSQLFRNEGGGHFVDVAAVAGVTNARYAKAVAWGDVDGDGWEDLYVSNMAAPNRLYLNRRDGTFTDVAAERGVDQPFSSFPAWMFDYDGDGALDIFVAGFGGQNQPPNLADVAASYLGLPFRSESLRLYRGNGRGGFSDVTREAGLARCLLPMGSNFGDVDGDGWLDIYLGTGFPLYEGLMPNVLLHNRGGKSFVDVTSDSGLGHLQKGHAVAFADFDDDGDQDVFARMGGAYPGDGFACALFSNPIDAKAWVKISLTGVRSNRFGVGARITVHVSGAGGERSIHRWVGTGGSFGCSPHRQEIGLGNAERIDRIEVRWPATGTVQEIRGAPMRKWIEITEGSGEWRERELRPTVLGGKGE